MKNIEKNKHIEYHNDTEKDIDHKVMNHKKNENSVVVAANCVFVVSFVLRQLVEGKKERTR